MLIAMSCLRGCVSQENAVIMLLLGAMMLDSTISGVVLFNGAFILEFIEKNKFQEPYM